MLILGVDGSRMCEPQDVESSGKLIISTPLEPCWTWLDLIAASV